MKNLITIIALIAIIGCKNNTDKAKQKQSDDTIEVAKHHEIISQKPEPIDVQTAVEKDTIRNEEATRMNEEVYQKATIDLSDSSLIVYGNIRKDYRIFGYQKPDTNSRKMVLFSVYTSDVKDNPYKCPFGSYYSSNAMENTEIKYVKSVGDFVKASLINNNNTQITSIYILKNWVQFETKN